MYENVVVFFFLRDFLSSLFYFISAAKTCRPNDTHARKLFLLFFFRFFYRREVRKRKKFLLGPKKQKSEFLHRDSLDDV